MTGQQRLTIRAELARRMGYSVVQSPYEEFRFYRLVSPNGERSGLCESKTEAWSLAPDPFTNAADKDALVAWLAADWVLWKKFFLEFTAVVIPAMMQSEDYLGRIGETDNYTIGPSKAEWGWALMTAPLETITLAACRALGIGEAE